MEGDLARVAVENKNAFAPNMGQKHLLLRYHPN